MRTDAAAAGEVLLACVVEDEPKEEFGSSHGVDHELGIEYDNEGYPTAPWKSPVEHSFRSTRTRHFGYLHQLINFSTGKYGDAVRERNRAAPMTLLLRLADGAVCEYAGELLGVYLVASEFTLHRPASFRTCSAGVMALCAA